MHCSPPGSSVHGISHARILEGFPFPSPGGSSPPRDYTWVSCIAGRFLTKWATREAPMFSRVGWFRMDSAGRFFWFQLSSLTYQSGSWLAVGWGSCSHWVICLASSNGLVLAFFPSNSFPSNHRWGEAKVEILEHFCLSFGLCQVCPMFKASLKLIIRSGKIRATFWLAEQPSHITKAKDPERGEVLEPLEWWIYPCACQWYGQHCLFISSEDK